MIKETSPRTIFIQDHPDRNGNGSNEIFAVGRETVPLQIRQGQGGNIWPRWSGLGEQWKEIIKRKGQVEGVSAALTCIGFLLKTSQSNEVRGAGGG